MKLELKRIARRPSYTIGQLYVDGIYLCDTIEDTDRGLTKDMSLEEIQKIKVKSETAIPSGTYQVILNMSARFKRLLPLLIGVPGYEGIRIHPGNTEKDTEGCILPGLNKVRGQVVESRAQFGKVFNLVDEAIKRGERVTITIS